jgi:hypothetical protein
MHAFDLQNLLFEEEDKISVNENLKEKLWLELAGYQSEFTILYSQYIFA